MNEKPEKTTSFPVEVTENVLCLLDYFKFWSTCRQKLTCGVINVRLIRCACTKK